jgi:hypothetical protein
VFDRIHGRDGRGTPTRLPRTRICAESDGAKRYKKV